MKLNLQTDYQRAFKGADIRGVYPTEIDDEVVYFLARAFVEEFGYQKVLVARDMRESSPMLHAAFIKGANDSGADVVDIGLIHSPGLYFASATSNLPGVMITASHSPREYNGLKLVYPQAIPLTEADGLQAVRKRMEKGVFVDASKTGKVVAKDITKAWQKFVLKGVSPTAFSGIKIAADAGNGMAGVILPLLAEKLAVKFDVLFPKLDGTFPNRGSDPTLSKHQKQIKTKVKNGTHDFGIAFDGDADRIAFFDETGAYINSAVVGALIAQRLLKKKPQAKIGYTVLTSRSYEESIRARGGGKPVLMKVGHAFIKKAMREKDVLFACEHSGHFYYKDYFFTDSVTLTLLYVLEAYTAAKEQGRSFSQMMKPYQMYQQTEDTFVEVDDKQWALAAVGQHLLAQRPLKLKKFDGYTVDFGDVWGVIKPSVTEFALKIMFESKSLKHAKNTQKELIAFVQSVAKAKRT
jgi:phosphomannomutase